MHAGEWVGRRISIIVAKEVDDDGETDLVIVEVRCSAAVDFEAIKIMKTDP
jgi:hypothetical protein